MDMYNKTSKLEAKLSFEHWLDKNPDAYEVSDDDYDVRAIMLEHNVTDVSSMKGWCEDYSYEDEFEGKWLSTEEAREQLENLGEVESKKDYKALLKIYESLEPKGKRLTMPTLESYKKNPEEISEFTYYSLLGEL